MLCTSKCPTMDEDSLPPISSHPSSNLFEPLKHWNRIWCNRSTTWLQKLKRCANIAICFLSHLIYSIYHLINRMACFNRDLPSGVKEECGAKRYRIEVRTCVRPYLKMKSDMSASVCDLRTIFNSSNSESHFVQKMRETRLFWWSYVSFIFWWILLYSIIQ